MSRGIFLWHWPKVLNVMALSTRVHIRFTAALFFWSRFCPAETCRASKLSIISRYGCDLAAQSSRVRAECEYVVGYRAGLARPYFWLRVTHTNWTADSEYTTLSEHSPFSDGQKLRVSRFSVYFYFLRPPISIGIYVLICDIVSYKHASRA